MKIKQMLTLPILVFTILTTGCAVTQKPPEYVSEMSEAKNIAFAGGLTFGIDDRPASKSNEPYTPGTSLGDLLAFANVAAGAFDGGVLGMGNVGSSAFNAAHGVWATSGQDDWSTNYFYAYIPKSWKDFSSPLEVRNYLNDLVVSESLLSLKTMGFKYELIDSQETLNSKPVQRWALGNTVYGCSIESINCVLTVYTVKENQVTEAVSPSFLGRNINEPSWKFWLGPVESKSNIDITSVGTYKTIPEIEFYTNLSKKMPNWFNLYIAPGRASSEGYENGVIPYNFIVKQGEILKFIDPSSI